MSTTHVGPETSSPASDASAPPTPKLELIPPDKIRGNPENPRKHFPPDEIEILAESIEQIGVQVPITVFREPSDDGTEYVLLDGERRWRASRLIDLEAIPASVVAKPEGISNMLRMFNIHMLREAWQDMPTAWALEHLMNETDIRSPAELHRQTGLGVDRIRNIQIVLKFPREVQEAVDRGEMKFNALVELWKATRPARQNPERLPFTAEDIEGEFLQRSLDRQENDLIDFRKLGRLISAAAEDSVEGEAATEALSTLMQDPGVTIEEAYEMGAASSFEVHKVLRDLDRLPQRLRRVFRTGLSDDQAQTLNQAIQALRAELDLISAEHRDASA